MDKRQQSQVTARKIPVGCKAKKYCHMSSLRTGRVAQKSCAISIPGVCQDVTEQIPSKAGFEIRPPWSKRLSQTTCRVSSTLSYPVAPHSSHSITFQHSWHARLHPTANPGNKLIMWHCASHITKILLSLRLNTCYLNFILTLHGIFSCEGYNSIKKLAL